MKVLLVSDSHGRVDRLMALFEKAQKAQVKHVIHAGDFAVEAVDKIFAKFPDINFYIAQGNCDVNEAVLEKVRLLKNCRLMLVVQVELEGIVFVVSHIKGMAQNKVKGKIDFFCHGHTHRVKIQKRDGFVVLNPGALCEDGGFFLIETSSLEVRRFLVGF